MTVYLSCYDFHDAGIGNISDCCESCHNTYIYGKHHLYPFSKDHQTIDDRIMVGICCGMLVILNGCKTEYANLDRMMVAKVLRRKRRRED